MWVREEEGGVGAYALPICEEPRKCNLSVGGGGSGTHLALPDWVHHGIHNVVSSYRKGPPGTPPGAEGIHEGQACTQIPRVLLVLHRQQASPQEVSRVGKLAYNGLVYAAYMYGFVYGSV